MSNMTDGTFSAWEDEREKVEESDELWFVFDLDGTLADVTHRTPLALEKKWDEFNAACAGDTPRLAESYLIRMIYAYTPYHRIMIITGRSDKYRKQTEEWLVANGIPYDELHMRPEGNHSPDVVIKAQLGFMAGLAPGMRNVAFVVEDRDKMVEVWRANGLTCFQCQKGNY
jgi:hypothetical protein